jgi:hypothetical protein
MKQVLFIFLLALSLFGQAQTQIKAYLDTKQFHAPGIGSYLEIYIEFAGYTVQFQPCRRSIVIDLGREGLQSIFPCKV